MAHIDRLQAVATLIVACLLTPLPGSSLGAQVTGVLHVSVLSGGSNTPLPGASIEVDGGRRVVTDDRGRAAIRGVPPGRRTLLVRAFGHADHPVDVDVANGRVTRVDITLPIAPFALAPLTVRGRGEAPAESGDAVDAIVLRVAEADPGVRDVADLLADVPGVTVVRRGGPGSGVSVQLRGGAADQLLVLLDGVPLNAGGSGAADLSLIDLEALESVVVLPGARSARYGSGALAGVVLLQSRTEQRRPVDAFVGAGSWGEREIGATATADITGDLTAAIGGRWHESEGGFEYTAPEFRGGGIAYRENAQSERLDGHLLVRHTRPGSNLSLRADASTTERGSPGAIAQPSLTGEQSHDRFGTSITGETSGPTGGVSARLALQRQRAAYRDPSPPFGQAYDDFSDLDQLEGAIEGWADRGTVQLRGGLQGRRLHIEATPLDGSSVTYHEAGAWAEASAVLDAGTDATLLLSGGVRADRHDLVSDPVFSPTLSAEYRRPSVQVTLRRADAFAPPSPSDLFFQEGVLVRANPDLRPERVRGEWTTSLTASREVGPASFRLEASAWKADVEDMILWFPDFRFIWSPDNYLVTRRGANASLTLSVRTPAGRHTVTGRAEQSEVEYADGGLEGQVAYRPRSTASISLHSDLGPASFTTRLSRIGTRRSVPGSELNALPPYQEVDLGIAFPLDVGDVGARLDLSISNLLNRSAALLADFPLPGRGWAVRLRLS